MLRFRWTVVFCVIALSATACGNDIKKKGGGPVIVGGDGENTDNNGAIENNGAVDENGGDEDPVDGEANNGATNDPVDGPVIRLSPEFIEFGEAEVCSIAAQSFVITNDGDAPLKVEDIQVVETTTADPGGVEFTVDADMNEVLTIAPGEASPAFTVMYAPKDNEADQGYLEISSNARTAATITLAGDVVSGTPKVFCPTSVRFTDVGADEHVTDWAVVENIGGAPLEIEEVALASGNPDEWYFTFPENNDPDMPDSYDTDFPPSTIQPGDAMYVRVHFYPYNSGANEGEMVVYTNDPVTPSCATQLVGN